MLHITVAHKRRPVPRKEPLRLPGAGRDPIEAVQLARLAGAVLEKSPEDLMAIAESNPLLIWEWLEAFRRRKQEAEAEARFWSAALATLATAVPEPMRTAAE